MKNQFRSRVSVQKQNASYEFQKPHPEAPETAIDATISNESYPDLAETVQCPPRAVEGPIDES